MEAYDFLATLEDAYAGLCVQMSKIRETVEQLNDPLKDPEELDLLWEELEDLTGAGVPQSR